MTAGNVGPQALPLAVTPKQAQTLAWYQQHAALTVMGDPWGVTMNLLAHAWLLGGGFVASVYDLQERRVPNAVFVALLATWPLIGIRQPGWWWADGVAGFVLVGLPLLALALTARLGMGDVSSVR